MLTIMLTNEPASLMLILKKIPKEVNAIFLSNVVLIATEPAKQTRGLLYFISSFSGHCCVSLEEAGSSTTTASPKSPVTQAL